GRVRSIGISNVNYLQLEELLGIARVKPTWVQNRCFAMRGWDDTVRKICREAGILYQGFSLLTANPEVVMNTGVRQVAGKRGCTAPEVVFAYARSLGILPLTGTTDETHMRQDLTPLLLSEEEIQTLGCL
ncbi:MAG: aldo/keto reductase, partial [Deltaproteobacteria bacterium]|nr:aldo/keto reductase [Deltaproteobacteria bacterium]